ncbi:hypothetical protein B7494_g7027 [Chlorociboria aeruginascens]|nr:hypothetical protein B7494_g7027 [Chlorociboria aeruginascens]
MARPDRGSELDDAVLALLPKDAEILFLTPHGSSLWTQSSRLDILVPLHGNPVSYFLKIANHANGLSMVRGEYESSLAILDVMPDFIPRPLGYGTCISNPDLHFYMQEFREMGLEMPGKEGLMRRLAEMHLKSAEIRERGGFGRRGGEDEGIFGFHLTTHNGLLPQDNSWASTWEGFFAQGMRRMLMLEEEAKGGQPEEMKILVQPLFEKVIPRLLRPMEMGGRSIKPMLIHGDFWDGNVAVDVKTGKEIVFDACCFWGHNEYDLRRMTGTRVKFGKGWLEEYFKYVPVTSPKEDFEDRMELYLLRSYCHDSALVPTDPSFRERWDEKVG